MLMKLPHQPCMLPFDGFAVVVYQEAVSFVLCAGAGVCEKSFKARYNLFKCLLLNRAGCSHGVKINFINALSKEPGITPLGNAVSYFSDKTYPFTMTKMHVIFGMVVILPDLLITLMLFRLLKLKKMRISYAFNSGASCSTSELVEAGNLFLLKIRSNEPCGVKFCIGEIVARHNGGYLAIGISPVPDWQRDTSKHEVRRVSGHVRGSRLVDVTEVHRPGCPLAEKLRLGC